MKNNNEEKKETEVSLGTLYEFNKSLVQSNEVQLSEGVINSKKEIIKNFIAKTENTYYMLLSNERRDYTIFTFKAGITGIGKIYDVVNILVDECLVNRGEIRGIDLTKTKDAIEIWMSIEGESYVYYFFPYDNAIIEI